MLDNDLFKEIITVLKAGFEAAELEILIKQSYQPTQQGVDRCPAVYLYKVSDVRYGHVYRSDVYRDDLLPPFMEHTEKQAYETTFQITAISKRDPADVSQLTSSDIINRAAAILQSEYAIGYFKSKGLAIIRIRDVRNIGYVDDYDQNEFAPNFDFTITHEQTTISSTPVAESIEFNFNRV